MLFPQARCFDLLLPEVYRQLLIRPEILREECEYILTTQGGQTGPIIIDEIQKIPELLDLVHWLIENRGIRFILCGSSARKLRRGHANLLGGRAVRYELFPLVYREITDFSLDKALNAGLFPRHYASERPRRLLHSYIGDYLEQEIRAEALTRNLAAFGRFLEIAAISNGEIINFTNIASDCGVGKSAVKGYFEILQDTLLGRFVPAFRTRGKRRVVESPKFFFCDIGIVTELTRRGAVKPGSELFGRAFEHFIFQELSAHASYSELFYPVSYWRTASGSHEIDFVLDDARVAVEVKGVPFVAGHHLKSLRFFAEEIAAQRRIVVSLDPAPRRTDDGIEILPWKMFLDELWDDRIIK